jgi:UDP-glucose 4-epimerase
MKRNVLVTGAAGFIGSHLIRDLQNLNLYNIVALDDLSGGFKENIPESFEFIECSINDQKLIEYIFKKYNFQFVFHLAAYAAEGLSHFIRRFNYTNNLIGSINLINESIKTKVECFVFTSSIAVYGKNQVPMTEEMHPEPEDPYGISKYAIELDLKNAFELFGLNSIIFRPHNVYGEFQNIGDKYRNVVGIFMNQILDRKNLSIFGDGEQQRAFSYVGDITPIMANSIHNKNCYNQVFNIGADKPYTVKELAEEVINVMKVKDLKIDYFPARNEVKIAYSDHSKIKKYFGDYKTVSLYEGLQKMAEWVHKVGARKSKKFENIEILENLPVAWLD